jgi:hypothetical protein
MAELQILPLLNSIKNLQIDQTRIKICNSVLQEDQTGVSVLAVENSENTRSLYGIINGIPIQPFTNPSVFGFIYEEEVKACIFNKIEKCENKYDQIIRSSFLQLEEENIGEKIKNSDKNLFRFYPEYNHPGFDCYIFQKDKSTLYCCQITVQKLNFTNKIQKTINFFFDKTGSKETNYDKWNRLLNITPLRFQIVFITDETEKKKKIEREFKRKMEEENMVAEFYYRILSSIIEDHKDKDKLKPDLTKLKPNKIKELFNKYKINIEFKYDSLKKLLKHIQENANLINPKNCTLAKCMKRITTGKRTDIMKEIINNSKKFKKFHEILKEIKFFDDETYLNFFETN